MQGLWVAVLGLAIDDALGRSRFNAGDYRRDGDPRPAARRWILEAGEDFHAVCQLAGFDPDGIRDAVLSGRVGELHLATGRPRPRTARPQGRAA